MYLIIISTLILVYGAYRWVKSYLDPFSDMPSPPSHFIYGHSWIYSTKYDILNALSEWAVQFKNCGLLKMDFLKVVNPSKLSIMVLNLDDQKKILSRPEIFYRTEFAKQFFPLTGHSLFNARGKDHQVQKRILGRAFSMTQMKYYVPVFSKHADRLVKVWLTELNGAEEGKNLEVKSYLANLTFDVIAEIGFGQDFNTQMIAANHFVQSLRDQIDGVFNIKWKVLLKYLPFVKYLPIGINKAIHNAAKNSQKLLDMVVEARNEKIKEGNLTETEKNDLLSMMMTDVDLKTGEKFSEQLIKDNSYTFFVAGHETTAASIPAILFYLAKFPDYQKRCRQEIADVLENKETKIGLEDLNKLPFTAAFIKESIRLYPAIINMHRTNAVETTVGGRTFPQDTLFVMPLYMNNTNEDQYDFAREFKPERYLDHDKMKKGNLFTFGYGPYNCIGKHFAMHEMKVTIVKLLQNFSFSIDKENQDIIRQDKFTLYTIPPMSIRVKEI